MHKIDILEKIPDKQLEWKDTTSRKWKWELYEFFKDKDVKNCLEIGTNHGWTAYWSSFIFDHVYSIEYDYNRYMSAKEKCAERDNITLINGDAYKDNTYNIIPRDIDVIIIDCIHIYDAVIEDINRALGYYKDKKIYIVFDDHGHPESTGVYQAIEQAINSGLVAEKYIGEPAGYVVRRPNNTQFQLIKQEGVILSYHE